MDISIKIPTNDFFGNMETEGYDPPATLNKYLDTVECRVQAEYPDANIDVDGDTGILEEQIHINDYPIDEAWQVEDRIRDVIKTIDMSDPSMWVARRTTAKAYRTAAHRLYHQDGEIEVDVTDYLYPPLVSCADEEGDEEGAYVQAWVWVSRDSVIPDDAAASPLPIIDTKAVPYLRVDLRQARGLKKLLDATRAVWAPKSGGGTLNEVEQNQIGAIRRQLADLLDQEKPQ